MSIYRNKVYFPVITAFTRKHFFIVICNVLPYFSNLALVVSFRAIQRFSTLEVVKSCEMRVVYRQRDPNSTSEAISKNKDNLQK